MADLWIGPPGIGPSGIGPHDRTRAKERCNS